MEETIQLDNFEKKLTITFLILFYFVATINLFAQKIGDISSIIGVRDNQLIGYSLVVGLKGTGDSSSAFTNQTLANLLKSLNIKLNPKDIKSKNVAAVVVTATLPPFARQGDKLDISVSSIGDAKSLEGGTLLLTPLKGVDGKIYALAQGNLIVGGLSANGADGSKITINIPSVGRIPNGASVERIVLNPFNEGDSIYLNLHKADFTTARRVTKAINHIVGKKSAESIDGGTIRVSAPGKTTQRVSFMAFLEEIQVIPGEAPAKIIINSRTGTIVIGSNVRVSPAAVTHGSLTVNISETNEIVQPNALANGETATNQNTDINVTEGNNKMFLFNTGVTLSEIVKAINEVGASPSDLVAILEALKQVGALTAELIVI